MNSNYSRNGPAPDGEEATPDLPLIPSPNETQIEVNESDFKNTSEIDEKSLETLADEIISETKTPSPPPPTPATETPPPNNQDQNGGGKRRRKTYKKARKYRKATIRRRR